MIRKYAEIFCWKNVSSFCSAKATHIFSAKNIRILYIESAKTVNEMTLNKLVKLTTLWTTGPICHRIIIGNIMMSVLRVSCPVYSNAYPTLAPIWDWLCYWQESTVISWPHMHGYVRKILLIISYSAEYLQQKFSWRTGETIPEL